jgi:polysaccharide export outer membrane protein
MEFQANARADASDPDSIPIVVEVTAQLIQQHAFELASARAAELKEIKPLLSPPSQYLIGPADVLSIIVWDHPELMMPNLTYSIGPTSGNLPASAGLQSQSLPGYVVSQSGFVQYPYIDVVHVAGLTEVQAKRLIASKLDPYIHNPQVTVRVIGYRSKKVFVGGEVRFSQAIPITDAPLSLTDALDTAGGISSTGDLSRISLTRGGRTYSINFPDLIRDGLSPAKIQLSDNDVVQVSPLLDKRVFALGEVLKPGSIPFRTNGRITLSEAIGDAGGVNGTTANAHAIYVIRPMKNQPLPEVFHLDARSPVALGLGSQFELKPQDIVYVDAPGLVRWSRIISLVTGSANGANAISAAVRDATTP